MGELASFHEEIHSRSFLKLMTLYAIIEFWSDIGNRCKTMTPCLSIVYAKIGRRTPSFHTIELTARKTLGLSFLLRKSKIRENCLHIQIRVVPLFRISQKRRGDYVGGAFVFASQRRSTYLRENLGQSAGVSI